MSSKFEVFEDSSNQWRWRLKARNGEIVAQSESYPTKQNAVRGAHTAAGIAADAATLPVEIVE